MSKPAYKSIWPIRGCHRPLPDLTRLAHLTGTENTETRSTETGITEEKGTGIDQTALEVNILAGIHQTDMQMERGGLTVIGMAHQTGEHCQGDLCVATLFTSCCPCRIVMSQYCSNFCLSQHVVSSSNSSRLTSYVSCRKRSRSHERHDRRREREQSFEGEYPPGSRR